MQDSADAPLGYERPRGIHPETWGIVVHAANHCQFEGIVPV